jgi:1-acyl-sn-glycerol-3-phosphate acyltransferase
MSKLFLAIYSYFENRRVAFWSLLLGYLVAAILVTFQLKLEEDITKIMPIEGDFKQYNDLLQKSEFANRIVIQLTTNDTLGNVQSVEKLTNFSDSLVAQLSDNLDSTLVKSITHKIDQSQFIKLYDVILDNLPLFLQKGDYQNIAEQIDSVEIESRIKGSYKALISPAGFAMKKPILRDPLGLAQNVLLHLQDFQIDDNFDLQNGYILTKDKRHQILFLSSANSGRETKKNGELLHILEETIQATTAQLNSDIQIGFFGAPAVAVGNAQQVRKDVAMTVGVALLVLFGLITFFYRRKRAFFLILIPTLFGGITALAALVILKGTVSLIAVGIGAILLGITIDYSLHIFTHYRGIGNVRQVIEDIATPILMSSLTTAGAFLCLLFVRSEALHDLGVFAAISILGSAVFALIILPPILKIAVRTETEIRHKKITFFDRFGRFELERIKWAFPIILGLSGVFFLMGHKANFETDLNALNYMSEELKASEMNLETISSASMRSMYLMAQGQSLAEAVKKSESTNALVDFLKKEGLVRAATPVSNVLISKELQEERIADWNKFWTAKKKLLVKNEITETAQKLKFKPSAFNDFFKIIDKQYQPVELAVFDPLKDLFLKENISKKGNETSLLTMLRVDLEDKKTVYQRFQNNRQVTVLDKELMTTRFIEILKADFDKFVIISMVFVFLILLISYGRIELAIITFLPLLLSWIWTLGLMNLFDIQFNIVNIIIATFIFGIGIDFSIFIMRGLLQEWQYGEHNLPSYKISILLSVITTLTGIGVMIFAQHPALKSIAALSIIGILSVLLIALVVEVVAFRWLVYRGVSATCEDWQPREYPITFLVILQTLANFLQLFLGCIVMTIVSFILLLCFFIPIKTRKRWVNYGIHLFGRGYIFANFPFNETYLNPHKEDFSKPGIAIANHQSLIDTPIMFRLSRRSMILTKDWVRRFPLFSVVTRMADFYSVSDGTEVLLPKLQQKLEENYTIAVFPEGSRSPNDTIKRFHKGSFYLAEKLAADIVPIYIHGTGRFLRKGSAWGKWNPLTIKIGERISPDDPRFSMAYSARTKAISKHFKENFAALQKECETVHYWREKLLENYLYKGPVLEWYLKIKSKMEHNYEFFDKIIPEKGVITNLGCGYGFLDYMLSFRSKERDILGIDYDEKKVKTAQNCHHKTAQINFQMGDIANLTFRKSDVFILADVLHYLPKESQYQVLNNCAKQLNSGGILLIRDGDADLKTRHKGTKWTEIFSTKIFNFNKAKHKLSFLSGTELRKWAADNDFEIEVIDETEKTSNVVFVMRK